MTGKAMPDAPISPIACRSILVLGGARSGKSRYALQLAEQAAESRLFIATAEAHDEEMAARIARHRAERGEGWTTLETTRDLNGALRDMRAGSVAVVDCLTLWLANLAFAGDDIAAEIERLCDMVAALVSPVIFVSNEVGLGIVPETPLGRDFRDWQGKLNQRMAIACDAVVFVAAGLPTALKPAPAPTFVLR
jgi:adenosylcobinamide kinase / adenosylcobinamide-phosphate guanylyltransferase